MKIEGNLLRYYFKYIESLFTNNDKAAIAGFDVHIRESMKGEGLNPTDIVYQCEWDTQYTGKMLCQAQVLYQQTKGKSV